MQKQGHDSLCAVIKPLHDGRNHKTHQIEKKGSSTSGTVDIACMN